MEITSTHVSMCQPRTVEVTMLYIYIVLLNTALATIIVYLLQLQFSLWGRKKRKVERNSEMGKNAEIERVHIENSKKERGIQDEKQKDEPSVEKDRVVISAGRNNNSRPGGRNWQKLV